MKPVTYDFDVITDAPAPRRRAPQPAEPAPHAGIADATDMIDGAADASEQGISASCRVNVEIVVAHDHRDILGVWIA